MFLFRKKKNINAPDPRLIARLNGKSLRYVTRRDEGDYKETVIGKGGSLNIRNDEVIIVCEAGEVLKKPVTEVVMGELLSNDGATFEFDGPEGRITIVAYYTYYRKVD
ncbi:MAG: hypothetical protein J6S59_06325 [Clostridia bacterium]|nr:hypothetical protein [Clostridia bacterium]